MDKPMATPTNDSDAVALLATYRTMKSLQRDLAMSREGVRDLLRRIAKKHTLVRESFKGTGRAVTCYRVSP